MTAEPLEFLAGILPNLLDIMRRQSARFRYRFQASAPCRGVFRLAYYTFATSFPAGIARLLARPSAQARTDASV